MLVTLTTKEGVVTSHETDNISDEAVKLEVNVIFHKINQLAVSIEAYEYASQAHRANLERILTAREETLVEPEEALDVSEEPELS